MSTSPTPFTASELADALRRCLVATATNRCLADVIEAIEDVQQRAGTLLAVARHIEEEMGVELGAVVLGGWAAEVLAPVPDVVPPVWLQAEGREGGQW